MIRENFRKLRRFLGPSWLTSEGESGLVGYSLDLVKDGFIERLELGLYSQMPGGTVLGQPADVAPADALAAMGRDRRVVRGFEESDESYAARLIAWLDDRRTAGNPYTLMQKLAEYTGQGPAFRTVDARGNWYSRAADGTRSLVLATGNWDWDSTPLTDWSRFWVIIYPNGLWTEGPDYGAATWGDVPGTWGSTATSEEVQTIRFLVGDWKPAGTICVKVIVAFDPNSFDPSSPEPDGLWGHWSKNVAGVQVPARLSTARYWDGVPA